MNDHTTTTAHHAAPVQIPAPRRRTKRLVAGAIGAVVAAGLLGSCGIAASRENARQPATSSTAAPPTTAKERPGRQDDDTTDAEPRDSDSRRGDDADRTDDTARRGNGGAGRTPSTRR